jgi:hypothetical protein
MSALAEPVVRRSHFEWPAIFAGVAGAAGISLTLHAFATGIGLSVLSAAPTWRDSAPTYWFLAGLYLLFVSLAAFGVGGYIVGRMRAPLSLPGAETEFRDGMHGLVVWGLAAILTALMALGVVATATTTIAPSGGSAGAAQSVAGENIIASELDELFRGDRGLQNINYRQSEAARILLKASSHNGVPGDDRDYLATITANATGLSFPEASARVDREIAAARQELHRARMAAVLQAFFAGAALLVGAAVAWFAACEGGRDREGGHYLVWDWSFRRRR